MAAIAVSARARRLGWLTMGALFVALVVGSASHVQSLPRARLGIAGSVDALPTREVTVRASLPRSYGLTPVERLAGWPALNTAREQEAVLAERFTMEFPRVSYCVTQWAWKPMPPPPVLYVLHFSDAPGEDYVLWRDHGGQPTYFVRRGGVEVPPEAAAWHLQLGTLERGPEDNERVPLWSLPVRFSRQSYGMRLRPAGR